MSSYESSIHLLVLVMDAKALEGCPLFSKIVRLMDGCRELQRVIFSTGFGLPYGFLWEISLVPVLEIKRCCSMKTQKN